MITDEEQKILARKWWEHYCAPHIKTEYATFKRDEGIIEKRTVK